MLDVGVGELTIGGIIGCCNREVVSVIAGSGPNDAESAPRTGFGNGLQACGHVFVVWNVGSLGRFFFERARQSGRRELTVTRDNRRGGAVRTGDAADNFIARQLTVAVLTVNSGRQCQRQKTHCAEYEPDTGNARASHLADYDSDEAECQPTGLIRQVQYGSRFAGRVVDA